MADAVEVYMAQFDAPHQRLLNEVRQLILQAAPGLTEHFKYQLPFYQYKGPLCYLNMKDDELIIGFVKGVFMSNDGGQLVGSQKQVRHLVLSSQEDIVQKDFLALLNEALLLNELEK